MKPLDLEPIARLGGGGMGDVFLARTRTTDAPTQLVALKRIRPALLEDAATQARFEREARVSALLRHPCIVATLDYGTDEQGPFLLLEYVEGRTTARIIALARERGVHVPLEVALSILIDVAEGLACAHEHSDTELKLKGVIHRDLTPDNVLVGYDGTARLADFGIAKILGSTDLSGAGAVTVTGAIAGKAGYIAPELYEGGAPSFASDLFSLGATAFRLLTGTAAFRADSEAGVMRAVLSASAPDLATLRPEVPATVSEVVSRCLAKEAAQRPASAREVADALSAALRRAQQARREQVASFLGKWFPERGPSGEAGGLAAAQDEASPRTLTASMGGLAARRSKLGPRAWRLVAWPTAVLLLAGLAVLSFQRASQPSTQTSGATAPPADATPSTPSTPAPATEPGPAAQKTEPSAREREEEPKGAEALQKQRTRMARLRLRIQPWALVFLDGRSLGSTPLSDQELPAGTHSLILVNPELGVRKSFTVRLRPGERKTFALTLGAKAPGPKQQASNRQGP